MKLQGPMARQKAAKFIDLQSFLWSSLPDLSVNGQIVNTLGFSNDTIPVPSLQLTVVV